jgi:hypothetical protein
MKRSVTTTEPAAAETTRRTSTCTRRRRGHETLINSLLSTAPVQSHGLTRSRSHALPVAAPSRCHSSVSHALAQNAIGKIPIPVFSHPFASPRQGCASLGKATQAPRENTSASLACKASFLYLMPTPQPFAGKTLALLRFVARNRALSLIIARYAGIPLEIVLSREWTMRHSPRTLTQANPALAQIFLSYGANFLSQSDPI